MVTRFTYGNIALDYKKHNETISYGRITKGGNGNPPYRKFTYAVNGNKLQTRAHVFIYECIQGKVMSENKVVMHNEGPELELRKDEFGYHRNWEKDLSSGDPVDNSRDYHKNRHHRCYTVRCADEPQPKKQKITS